MSNGAMLAGKYELMRTLGSGAMGTVWSARNVLTQRDVAIKVLARELAASEDAKRRMLREASACGRLNHPNVVQVFDVGTSEDGAPFLVMELLRGESVADRLSRTRCVSTTDARFIGRGMLRALAAAHAAGIVHRDLKPANVFLHDDPHHGITVKVVDFGISKVLGRTESTTMTGMAVGSPAYMSPEQAKGDVRRLDHRTDLWSFGVVMFEMLSGRRPFVGESAFEVVSEILKGDIPKLTDVDPAADAGLSALVARCLVREIEARVATAEQAIAFLEDDGAASSSPSLGADRSSHDPSSLVGGHVAAIARTPAAARSASASSTLPLPVTGEAVASTKPFSSGQRQEATPRSRLSLAAAAAALGVIVAGSTVALLVKSRSAGTETSATTPTEQDSSASAPRAASPPASAVEVAATATGSAVEIAPSAPAHASRSGLSQSANDSAPSVSNKRRAPATAVPAPKQSSKPPVRYTTPD